jgi:very-short-patch-repair endonuclease/predicted transcriptional regulator of viral defense system
VQPTVDSNINELAAQQHGLVTRAQLLRAGVPPERVRWRVRMRRLVPLHRGVYRVGPVALPYAREAAAVLACGPHAAISHVSAAALWQLTASGTVDSAVHITSATDRRGRRRPGLCLHYVSCLPADDVTQMHGIPVTTVARTIVDVAGDVSMSELTRMVALAQRNHDVRRETLLELLARCAGQRGVRTLRVLLAEPPALTRSEAELRFLNLVRKARLPRPEANVKLDRYEVDFLWRAERLVVEVDGFAFHASRGQFENDRRRDAALTACGFRVMRFTWAQLSGEPEVTLVRLAQALLAPTRG